MDEQNRRNEDIAAYSRYEKSARAKNVIRAISVTVIALALVAAVGVFVLKHFFAVETVIVDGSETYASSEIIETSGVREGDIIFFVWRSAVENRLKSRFAYIREVEIVKEYPSSVNIIITEEEPVYYIEYDGEYFILNDEMKVLEKYTEKEKLISVYGGLKPVYIPDVYKSIVSDKIEFISAKDTRHVGDLLLALHSWEEFEKINEIDISNRFEISFLYDNRLTIELGSKSDLDKKLQFITGIISAYSDEAYGTIIIDSVGQAIARVTDPAADDE